MDILLIFLSGICLITGLAGSLLPLFPGPPLAWVGMYILYFTEKAPFNTFQLVTWALLAVIVQLINYLTPMWGTRKWGDSPSGKWGSFIGTLAGIVFFRPGE